MNILTIKKDGFYSQRWNSETKSYDDEKKLDDIEMCRSLRESVEEIEEDVTLGDIIRVVAESETLKLFISCYNRSPLDKLHDFMLNVPIEENAKDEDWKALDNVEYIELYWHGDIYGRRDSYISLYPGSHGIGKVGTGSGEVDKGARADGRERYAMGFTPANELAQLPVKMNSETNLYLLGDKIECEDMTIGDRAIIKTTNCFSLLEVLDALYEELTFYGEPESQYRSQYIKDIKQDLKDTMENLDADMEDGKVLPWKVGDKEKGEKDIYLADQVRDFMGLPSNEEDRDEQIRNSADEL